MTPVEAIKAFLEALDRKRQIAPWLTGGAYVEVVHSEDCYREHRVCGCGGFEQRGQINDAIEGLRAAVENVDPFKTMRHPAPPITEGDLP
jgi:hypothetical protein